MLELELGPFDLKHFPFLEQGLLGADHSTILRSSERADLLVLGGVPARRLHDAALATGLKAALVRDVVGLGPGHHARPDSVAEFVDALHALRQVSA